jgi:hypothetical protein
MGLKHVLKPYDNRSRDQWKMTNFVTIFYRWGEAKILLLSSTLFGKMSELLTISWHRGQKRCTRVNGT